MHLILNNNQNKNSLSLPLIYIDIDIYLAQSPDLCVQIFDAQLFDAQVKKTNIGTLMSFPHLHAFTFASAGL